MNDHNFFCFVRSVNNKLYYYLAGFLKCSIHLKKKLLIINIFIDMIIKVNKHHDKQKLDEALRKLKPAKLFKASRHFGKVKWNEDALDYQKRIRGEWN